MEVFINDYNKYYTPPISFATNGVCTLGKDVDKWGVELRIYLKDISGMPKKWTDRVYRNKKLSILTPTISKQQTPQHIKSTAFKG